MNLNLRENMYIRTKDGIIDKIVKLNKSYVKGVSQKDELYAYDIDNIVKASYNIIDILEEGDYVNGKKVGYIDDCEGAIREYYYDYEDVSVDVGHWFEEIKSIVTKEQFESMQYKVD